MPQLRLLSFACLLLALGGRASAQPWEGWHAPLVDGWEGIRFGMDRATTAVQMQELGYTAMYARSGMLRYGRHVDGHEIELMAEFVEDARAGDGGRLCRLLLLWESLEMPTSRVLRIFEALEQQLELRYDVPLFAEQDGANALDGGRGRYIRMYQGPEMQAILELRAVRQQQFRILLTLDSPQLQPELPGG